MKKKFNKLMTISLTTSILFCVVGLVLITHTHLSLETMAYIMGGLLIVHGTASIIDDYKQFKIFYFFDGFTTGILSIILGIVIISNLDYMALIVPITFGVWMILSSTFKLRMALALKDAHNQNWVITYVLSILTIITGLCLIFNPEFGALTITKVIGGLCLIYGIIDIIGVLIFKKNIKSIVRIFE